MRTLILVVTLAFVGCTSEVPVSPIEGPAGERGEKGDTGPQGPVGPAGASAVGFEVMPQGAACPAGGVLVKGADGGQLALCNGAQGLPGATGAPGATGPQGPKGDMAPSLSVWSQNGDVVGPLVITSAQDVDKVFVNSAGCVGQIDYDSNTIKAFNTTIYYTGTGCTGQAFVPSSAGGNTFFPLGCVEMAGNTYKVQMPVLRQRIPALSKMSAFNIQSDGGYTPTCTPENATYLGGFVQPVTPFNPPAGPYFVGKM